SNNTNYDVTFVNGTYEITKVPTIVPPISGLVAVKGDLISSVILPKGFSYIDSSIVLNNAGNYTTDVIYTPEDTVNYDAVKVTVTIYVKDIFTVEFKDGNIVLNTVSVIEGMDAVAPMNPIKNGYTFNGWDISFKNVTKNLIINTLWKIENYSITYIGIEGTLNVENNPLSYTINSATFTLDNPVKNNYTFIGWTDENSLNPTKNMTVVTGSFGNKTYTANFEANVTGIVVNRLQPLKFAVGSSPIIEDYIEVYELRANGTKGRKLNRNEWSANVNTSYLVKNKPLTVTRISNNVTDSTLTYDVLTNDEYLQLTKFQITFNSNKQYTKCISYAWKKTYSEQYDRDLYLCNGTEVKTAKYNFFEITEHYLQNITNIQVTAYYSDDLGNVFGESLIEEDSHYSTGQVNNIKYGPKYRVHFKNKDVITDDSLKYVEIQYRRSGKGTFKIIFDYDMTLNKFTARIEYQLVNENWVPYNQG
ncbi:MAG: InlB B-repeat-containing protein, partial [Bacilli bacterium]